MLLEEISMLSHFTTLTGIGGKGMRGRQHGKVENKVQVLDSKIDVFFYNAEGKSNFLLF